MTLVLDAGGVSGLAEQRAPLIALRDRGLWPAEVPAPVLTEALTGDHRHDVHVNRLPRACLIRPADEVTARSAARLRTATGRATTISATDAIVAAHAAGRPDPIVLTSDPSDIGALVQHAERRVTVVPI